MMKTKETSQVEVLYNKEWNDYAYWNGNMYVGKISGANFYTVEKAANNGYFPVKTPREKALAWWNSLSDDFEDNSKFQAMHNFLKNNTMTGFSSTEGRHLSSLTGNEIERIWETKMKSNQKQFKVFDENLFKAYINKFSNEDKMRALKTLCSEISTTNPKISKILNEASNICFIK